MRRFVFIVIFAAAFGAQALAQNLSYRQTRHMNENLLDLLDKYENYSTFTESYMDMAFASLFVREGGTVLCDYPSSLSFGKVVPLDEYTRFSITETESIQLELRNVRRSDYVFKNGRWTVELTMNRFLSYIDRQGILFETSHDIRICCEYRAQDDIFKIQSIVGMSTDEDRNKPWYIFPGSRFYIVSNGGPHDKDVLCDGQKLKFDDYGFSYTTSSDFRVNDDDLVLKVNEVGGNDAYSLINFSYTPLHARLRFHGDYALVGGYKVSTADNNIASKSRSFGFGLEVGYMWTLGKSFKLGVASGIGMTIGSIEFRNAGEFNYDYSYDIPAADGDGFRQEKRNYTVTAASEKFNLQSVYLPIYLTTEYKLYKGLSLAVDLGPRLNLNTRMSVEPYSITGKCNGADLSMRSDRDGMLSPVSYARNTFDVSIYARAGVDYSIKGRHNLGVRIGYEYGLMPVYSAAREYWYGNSQKIYPVVFDGTLKKDVMVSSMASAATYTRNALWLELGYKLKF